MDTAGYDSYLNILRQRLSEYRLHHSLEVAASCRYLAEKYGGNAEKLYVAGLLHDVMKEADPKEIFSLAERDGVVLSEIEKKNKKLWHAIAGAAYIRRELKIDDEEILTAVRYHTTGRAHMSLSEKILFVADFISADRSYEGVDVMRAKAEISLETAMLEGLRFTLQELIEQEKCVHPDTLDAYNDILMNRREVD